jgi:hypothetical protein
VAPPLAYDLPDVLPGKAVTLGDFLAAPAQNEIQEHDLALKFALGVPYECRNLTRKADLVGPDCFPKLIQFHLAQIQMQVHARVVCTLRHEKVINKTICLGLSPCK